MRTVPNRRYRNRQRTKARIYRICVCPKKQTLCHAADSGRAEAAAFRGCNRRARVCGQAVGVFVNESPEKIAELSQNGVIDIIQLHGDEDEGYIRRLKQYIDKPIIKAFRVKTENDTADAERCSADYILLDSGAGTGTVFDWKLLTNIHRPYFLAGGLSPDNVGKAVAALRPFAVDVSSGIETDGTKDKEKMAAFAAAVRKEENL